jgi:hypothetical protein
VPWAAAESPWPDRTKQPYLPRGWESFDCEVTATNIRAKPGRKLIWVGSDRSIFEYLEGRLAVLEIGAKFVPGVSSRGVYGPEAYNGGALQWTSQIAYFQVPNNPAMPPESLRLALWPMQLSGNTLKISVNGDTVYRGAIPSDAVTIPLDKFAAQDQFMIELQTDALTRYPNDPRELGVAIRELRLSKRPIRDGGR